MASRVEMISRKSLEYLVGKSNAVARFSPLWRKWGHLYVCEPNLVRDSMRTVIDPQILTEQEHLPEGAKLKKQSSQAEHVCLRIIGLATENFLQNAIASKVSSVSRA